MSENISFHNLDKQSFNDYSDIIIGLTNKEQKKISSKYFYDKNGSELFDKITLLEDYYPTRIEMEILETYEQLFFNFFPANASVIEFGSGSNKKIKKLLKNLNKPSEYIPIDISKDFLFKNASEFAKDFPELKVKAVCADFDQIDGIEKIVQEDNLKIGFFPGSTIGNYNPNDAKNLLKKFSKILGKNNYLIIGVDLKKDVKVIEKAYNDSEGITALFNKNILNGVNRIVGKIFKTEDFYHKAFFNQVEGRIEMHLVSKKDQTVDIQEKKIHFNKGESIHTENSYKYSVESFKNLVESAEFEIKRVLSDKKSFYGVFFLKVKNS